MKREQRVPHSLIPDLSEAKEVMKVMEGLPLPEGLVTLTLAQEREEQEMESFALGRDQAPWWKQGFDFDREFHLGYDF